MACCVWLLSRNALISWFLRVVAFTGLPSFLRMNDRYSILRLYHTLFIQPSADRGHQGSFHFLATINNAAVDICVPVCVRTYVPIALGRTPRSGLAGSKGNPTFSLFKTRQTFLNWLHHVTVVKETRRKIYHFNPRSWTGQ